MQQAHCLAGRSDQADSAFPPRNHFRELEEELGGHAHSPHFTNGGGGALLVSGVAVKEEEVTLLCAFNPCF